MPKPKLGRYLEWHGNRIRVVVRVPPSQKAQFGSKLRETLTTRDRLEAESEKVPVVRRLRARLRDDPNSKVRHNLIDAALSWRDAQRDEDHGVTSHGHVTVAEALDHTVDQIAADHGQQAADTFAAIATGAATPLQTMVHRWFEEGRFSIGYMQDVRRVLDRLEEWCATVRLTPSIEAISPSEAGRFIHAQYVAPKVNHTTANKNISCLTAYWRWMRRRGVVTVNPWEQQRIAPPSARHDVEVGEKRPFTDEEVCTLLRGIRTRREWDFSLFSALSGLRIDEIGSLRVKDCDADVIAVVKSKTPSGKRTIPVHPALVGLIAERSSGKPPSAFLFDELAEQSETSKRGRSAPVTQAFSRERVRLNVNDRASVEQRQSNVDFHSWRRWFIRQAVNGLERGGVGYTYWTIANVVGHKVEGGKIEGVELPLAMTMGRYPGKASPEAMVACMNAVVLPIDTTPYRPPEGTVPARSIARSRMPRRVR